MEYYVVCVNLGSANHPVYKIHDGDGREHGFVAVDDSFDCFFSSDEVRRGFLDRGGVVYYFAETLEEAESVKTGVDMVRKMIRSWIDP